MILCPGRAELGGLTGSQVTFGTFATPGMDGLLATTIAMPTAGKARRWLSVLERPGLATCILRHETSELRGRLVQAASPRLRVGTQGWELAATFKQAGGGQMKHIWAATRHGRLVYVIHGFWFPDDYGVAIAPGRILGSVIARAPSS